MRVAYLEKRDTEKQQFRFYRIIITHRLQHLASVAASNLVRIGK